MSLSLLPSSSSLYSSVAASGSMPASSYVRRELVAAALRPAILCRIRLSPSQRSLSPPRRPTPTPWRGSSHGGVPPPEATSRPYKGQGGADQRRRRSRGARSAAGGRAARRPVGQGGAVAWVTRGRR